ncbi:PP78/83 [Urbanus proteus nucleopolyhedrovirus]|uniref:PP78/83 n=1 Tax=Urbanus proteus nucleopolyhedrovirus TaxID=1675866 RepID=A0A162GUC7_9ABAC|nr:PP78/83 [Urbanus proteus nucleopolyhedrovirus]AKR17333.1 PP78/83 [Urbanus proteus nucleopolyhedrovirus]
MNYNLISARDYLCTRDANATDASDVVDAFSETVLVRPTQDNNVLIDLSAAISLLKLATDVYDNVAKINLPALKKSNALHTTFDHNKLQILQDIITKISDAPVKQSLQQIVLKLRENTSANKTSLYKNFFNIYKNYMDKSKLKQTNNEEDIIFSEIVSLENNASPHSVYSDQRTIITDKVQTDVGETIVNVNTPIEPFVPPPPPLPANQSLEHMSSDMPPPPPPPPPALPATTAAIPALMSKSTNEPMSNKITTQLDPRDELLKAIRDRPKLRPVIKNKIDMNLDATTQQDKVVESNNFLANVLSKRLQATKYSSSEFEETDVEQDEYFNKNNYINYLRSRLDIVKDSLTYQNTTSETNESSVQTLNELLNSKSLSKNKLNSANDILNSLFEKNSHLLHNNPLNYNTINIDAMDENTLILSIENLIFNKLYTQALKAIEKALEIHPNNVKLILLQNRVHAVNDYINKESFV